MRPTFILVLLFLVASGCAGGKGAESKLEITEAQLQIATTQSDPSKREAKNLRKLSEHELALVNRLLANSNRRSLAYVSCEYYIQFTTDEGPRRLGLVRYSNGETLGFDVSAPDAMAVWTTGFHTVLEPRNKALAAELLKSLRN